MDGGGKVRGNHQKFLTFLYLLGGSISLCLGGAERAWGQPMALGELGIGVDSLWRFPYQLTGQKIALGQVEMGRPSRFGLDKLSLWPPLIPVVGVFFQGQGAIANLNLDTHAAQVSSVLVGRHKGFSGVAPGASLYAGAFGPLKSSFQGEQCLTLQNIAQQNGGDVRAINLSFGDSLTRDSRVQARLDGESLLSRCLDWLGRTENVLMVVAGNQGRGGIPLPTDHYNGMTVGFTRPYQGHYSRLDFANLSGLSQESNEAGRNSVSLVAPGTDIMVYDLKGKLKRVTGSSFAAPQVVGTVALLQEWADRHLKKAFDPTFAHRRYEVMKAILINAADKIGDRGDGAFLGMSRTIYTPQLQTWLQSPAYINSRLPLDPRLGSGQLNAPRALRQFQSGPQAPTQPVTAIGWNYDFIAPAQSVVYPLALPLAQHSFVALTLVWSRLVHLQDHNNNGQYDLGESFSSQNLANLELSLETAAASAPTSRVCTSRSRVDNLEHIFCPIPQTGPYHIRVEFKGDANLLPPQAYSLAWWTVSPP